MLVMAYQRLHFRDRRGFEGGAYVSRLDPAKSYGFIFAFVTDGDGLGDAGDHLNRSPVW